MKTETIPQIKGRNRWSDTAATTISILDEAHEPVLVIEGGYLEPRADGRFVVAAKHPTAVDREGDSSYVALLDGAGLTWTGMMGRRQTFTGALFNAQYVEDHEAQNCIDAQGYLNFTPPAKKWTPGVYRIEVRYL